MITKEQKVAEVFEQYPQAQAVFARFGFHALLNPLLRKTLGKVTTIERGCKLHRVPLDHFLQALNQAASRTSSPSESPHPSSLIPLAPADRRPQATNKILQANVGVLVQQHPEVKIIFTKYFGPGCFECPAFGTETVSFACLMHHTDLVAFARDCLALIESSRTPGKIP